ncbi:MAG: hypothetical protein HDR57_05625 [Treponema sp.]|nr:hypothetical protein [Treponema sp.]
MNTIFSHLKKAFPLIALFFVLALIFIPISNLCIELFLIADYLFAISFLLMQILSTKKPRLLCIYKSIDLFCVFTCGIFIAATRTLLTLSDFDTQLNIVRIIGGWICRENAICGFFTTLFMGGAILFFCKQFTSRAAENSARLCLDEMNQKLFDIDQRLSKKEITEDEAKNLKKQVAKEIDYYSNLDGSAHFLENTIICVIILFIVVTLGGFAVGLLENHLSWQDALTQYTTLSSGYLVVFLIPLFIVDIGIVFK